MHQCTVVVLSSCKLAHNYGRSPFPYTSDEEGGVANSLVHPLQEIIELKHPLPSVIAKTIFIHM